VFLLDLQTHERFGEYDRVFQRCHHDMVFSPHIMDAIVAATEGRFLDIGTGDGTKLHRILISNSRLTEGVALEPSALVREAQELLCVRPRVDVLQLGLEDYVPDAPFDAVFCFEVIEHIPRSMHEAFLARIADMLVPSGVLVLSTPNRPVNRVKTLIAGFRDPTHVAELTRREVQGLLTPHFTSVTYYGTLPWMGAVRVMPVLQRLNARLNPLLISHALTPSVNDR
jgi:2-polyprenyl-3-methyl-5-hydroxy-6-metoxy-1,4-benzoquinol methylase